MTTPQRSWLVGLLAVFFLSALPSQSGNSQKVILISLDGGMNKLLHTYMKHFPKNEGFARLKKEGRLATQGMTVPLPSLTATSHISLITGLSPGEHGIVSNTFHNISTPMTQAE